MVNYANIEEVWGKEYNNNNTNNNINNNTNNLKTSNLNYSDNNLFKLEDNSNELISTEVDRTNKCAKNSTTDRNNYMKSTKDAKDAKDTRDEIIKNMNKIERDIKSENNTPIMNEYNRYRINPYNKISENEKQDLLDTNKNNDTLLFDYSIEKKFLKDKLYFLEEKLRKFENQYNLGNYKDYNHKNSSNISNDIIENFENNSNSNSSSTDIIDLIVLIIIGLIIIFIMNSIFNLGKTIGMKLAKT